MVSRLIVWVNRDAILNILYCGDISGKNITILYYFKHFKTQEIKYKFDFQKAKVEEF